MKKIPNTNYRRESAEPKHTRLRQLSAAIQIWWFDTQPPFAICLDCGTKGLVAAKFASLLPGRVTRKPFTAAGTCISCAIYGQSDEDLPSQ